MTATLLDIAGLHAAVNGKEIIKGLDLTVNKGEVHVIMGPNGAGKSTLVNLITGHPNYEVTAGSIRFDGEDISGLKPHERARRGIFLSFQNPEEIPGVTVENFLRTARNAVSGEISRILAFQKELKATMRELNMDDSYAGRYLNVGFSGGEKKKNEILQLLMLRPKLAILDETDSGLDIDAVKIVSAGVSRFKNQDNAVLIITHNAAILEQLQPDRVHVLINGRITASGDTALIETIQEQGFARLEQLAGATGR